MGEVERRRHFRARDHASTGTMRSRLVRLLALLDRMPTWSIALLSCGLIAVLCLVDVVTGYEVSFSIFYLIPVALAAWSGTGRLAVGVSFLAAAAWGAADALSGNSYSNVLIPVWNTAVRLGFFIVVAQTLSNLRLALRRQAELARTDFLTQAANKRAFIELAGQEIERARRYSHPFSIAYLDVDRFKQVNDTLGHAAGDSLLVAVSDTAGRIARSPDVLARLGGDEFALLLVESDPEQTRSAVERVKRALDDAVMAGGWDVGFSIGATTFLTPPVAVARPSWQPRPSCLPWPWWSWHPWPSWQPHCRLRPTNRRSWAGPSLRRQLRSAAAVRRHQARHT